MPVYEQYWHVGEIMTLGSRRQLGTARDALSDSYTQFCRALERIGAELALRSSITGSRCWEYPWVWAQLQEHRGATRSLLDVGTGASPFPWYAARKGYRVTIGDVSEELLTLWTRAAQAAGNHRVPHRVLLHSEELPHDEGSFDVVTSVSVLEHLADPREHVREMARVLRDNGIAILTCDLSEPELGTRYPAGLGNAFDMKTLDRLIEDNSDVFVPPRNVWSVEDVDAYLEWMVTWGPTYSYGTAGLVLLRRPRI